MTIGDALSEGFTAVGQRDARLFMSHVTGFSISGLYFNTLKELYNEKYELYISFLERRCKGEPLQYIIGQWDFMGLTLFTDKRALIPRPETELLVEEAFHYISSCEKPTLRILDLCTGSGCIAVSVACLTDSRVSVTAVDISADALALAKENASKFGLSEERITFVQSDLLENVTGEFDIIISNPPYILNGEMENLSPTVRDYEPHLALDGGADGLDIYRRLIPQCKVALSEGGVLFLEIGPVAVMDLMISEGFKNVSLLRDYAELERIVSGWVD